MFYVWKRWVGNQLTDVYLAFITVLIPLNHCESMLKGCSHKTSLKSSLISYNLFFLIKTCFCDFDNINIKEIYFCFNPSLLGGWRVHPTQVPFCSSVRLYGIRIDTAKQWNKPSSNELNLIVIKMETQQVLMFKTIANSFEICTETQ